MESLPELHWRGGIKLLRPWSGFLYSESAGHPLEKSFRQHAPEICGTGCRTGNNLQ